jgi:hypothetical protein
MLTYIYKFIVLNVLYIQCSVVLSGSRSRETITWSNCLYNAYQHKNVWADNVYKYINRENGTQVNKLCVSVEIQLT